MDHFASTTFKPRARDELSEARRWLRRIHGTSLASLREHQRFHYRIGTGLQAHQGMGVLGQRGRLRESALTLSDDAEVVAETRLLARREGPQSRRESARISELRCMRAVRAQHLKLLWQAMRHWTVER